MVRGWRTTECQRHWRSTNPIVTPTAVLNPKEKATPIWVTQCWGIMLVLLGKNLSASTAQVKGSVSVHRASIFQGIKRVMGQCLSVFPDIKSMMAQCKNGTKNKGSYGCYERFPILMIRRLDFGKSIPGMGLPTSEQSALAALVLLGQEGCVFQRRLLDDHGLHFLSFLEWWRVPRCVNNHYPSSDECLEMERGGREARLFINPWRKAHIALHCWWPMRGTQEFRTNQI